jgi:hypothetical protein
LTKAIMGMANSHNLMIMMENNQGHISQLHGGPVKCGLFLVGNLITAEKIVSLDLRGSYPVPFRVAIYAEANGRTYVTYDLPSSLLRLLQNHQINRIAVDLDQKIEATLANL